MASRCCRSGCRCRGRRGAAIFVWRQIFLQRRDGIAHSHLHLPGLFDRAGHDGDQHDGAVHDHPVASSPERDGPRYPSDRAAVVAGRIADGPARPVRGPLVRPVRADAARRAGGRSGQRGAVVHDGDRPDDAGGLCAGGASDAQPRPCAAVHPALYRQPRRAAPAALFARQRHAGHAATGGGRGGHRLVRLADDVAQRSPDGGRSKPGRCADRRAASLSSPAPRCRWSRWPHRSSSGAATGR